MNKALSFLGAAALSGLFAVSANAASIDILDIKGTWTSATGTSVDGLTTDSIRWGNSTGDGRSGYDFDSATTPITNVVENVLFTLGEFVHVNKPITGGSITSATLKVVTKILVGGVEQVINSNFTFNHLETPNDPGWGNDCANGEDNGDGVNANGCADRVTAVLNLGSTQSFFVDDDEYVFNIEQFKVGSDAFSEFWTTEKAENSALLQGRFLLKECAVANPISTKCKPPIDPEDPETPAGVPLPAAAWLMLAGLGSLGVAKRRRRN